MSRNIVCYDFLFKKVLNIINAIYKFYILINCINYINDFFFKKI